MTEVSHRMKGFPVKPGMTGRRPDMKTGDDGRERCRVENGPPAQEVPGGWSC